MAYSVTHKARSDVAGIWEYIASDNESAADRFVDRLIYSFQILGKNPYAGRKRDDLKAGYRSFPAGEYLVFYKIDGKDIAILHIVHGRRDLSGLLGEA